MGDWPLLARLLGLVQAIFFPFSSGGLSTRCHRPSSLALLHVFLDQSATVPKARARPPYGSTSGSHEQVSPFRLRVGPSTHPCWLRLMLPVDRSIWAQSARPSPSVSTVWPSTAA